MPVSASYARLVPVSPAVEYRPAIDGLRALAVLAVFLFHLNRQSLPGGFVGVDIFFVLSGYLITSIILRDCERDRFSFGRFYQRRIARLLAAFFSFALPTIIAALLIYSDQNAASAGAALSAAASSLANFKFLMQGNYFVLSPDAQPFLHCWSLSVEEQFYLLFPAAFVLLDRKASRFRTHVLVSLCTLSLLLCIALTHVRPEWAFYLLPTRAWELLAGAVLATLKKKDTPDGKLPSLMPYVGLALIGLSLFVIAEGSAFPGYLAVLPVAGTACFLIPYDLSRSFAERLLSWGPLPLIGRMSYSLYLWHWPVFSFVDYRFYLTSSLFRIALKVLFSAVATYVCFFFIESPSRAYLNHPGRRGPAFAFLGSSLLLFVPLGLVVRNVKYINADVRDVSKGGLHFNQDARNGSIILMGDSNGSMYGRTVKELARELGMRLDVISVAAGDPLPRSSGENPPLWAGSLAVVKKEKPDFAVLVCNWVEKLKDDRGRLALALREIKQFAHFVIIITQPPELPEVASREGMRNGARPPFLEDSAERSHRRELNELVKSFQGGTVMAIDVEPLFSESGGAIRFADKGGNELYQNADHLSGIGANLVKADLFNAINQHKPHRE